MKLFNQVKQPVVVDLAKITKLNQELQWIDGELKDIDRYCKLLACGKSESVMNFTIVNTGKKTRRDKVIDSDGDLIDEDAPQYSLVQTGFGLAKMFYGSGSTSVKETSESWNPSLSPETMLRIMQVIFNDKTKERAEILKKIEKEGIKIK